MALDGLNAAAAAAILNQAKVDSATRTRGVIVSAFVPGPLGLAVPVIMARNAAKMRGAGGGGGGTTTEPGRVVVPNISTGRLTVDQATARLKGLRLVADPEPSYGDDADKNVVIGQHPEAGRRVPLDSQVTIYVGAGVPPADTTTESDLDKDLTAKMNKLAQDSTQAITAKLDSMQTALTTAIGNISTTGSTKSLK
jgi:PASTA domain